MNPPNSGTTDPLGVYVDTPNQQKWTLTGSNFILRLSKE